jgi:hypothetical protein
VPRIPYPTPTIGVDLDRHVVVLVPVALLLVGGFGGFGYSLAIGGLTLLWKRVELLNDMLIVFFLGAVIVSLDDMLAWMAAVGRLLPVTHPITAARAVLLDGRGLSLTGDGGLVPMVATAAAWLAAGIVAFNAASRHVRLTGTLTPLLTCDPA